jgi:hypothetical protein
MSEINRYYEILGLKVGASLAEVKQAYRSLAKTWHPDRFTDNPQLQQQALAKIKDINEADQQLKDYQPNLTQASTTQGVRTKASNPEIYYNHGAEKVKAGLYQAASEDFGVAIRLNPNYAEAYRYRGFVRSLLGFELGAEADLRKAAELGLRQKIRVVDEAVDSQPPLNDLCDRHVIPNVAESESPRPSQPIVTPTTLAEDQFVPAAPWQCVQTLIQTSAVSTIALSPDSKFLASGNLNTICLWNLRTGKQFGSLLDHSAVVRSLSFSPDGQFLASGSDDKTVKLWHLRTGTPIRSWIAHAGAVQAVVICDRQTLLSGGSDGLVKSWDLSSGKYLGKRLGQNAPIASLLVSPDQQTLVSSSEDGTVKLWHLKLDKLLRVLEWQAIAPLATALSSDGQFLVLGTPAQTVMVWSLKTDLLHKKMAGHTAPITSVAFAFVDQAEILVSSSQAETIFWNFSSGELLYTSTQFSAVTSLIYSSIRSTLISASDNFIKLWQCKSV